MSRVFRQTHWGTQSSAPYERKACTPKRFFAAAAVSAMYFPETGASQRPSTVIYDRAESAISEMQPDQLDWPRVFAGAHWFHVTGITPALGERAAACTREAVSAARPPVCAISVDLNFRKKLWTRGAGAIRDAAAR